MVRYSSPKCSCKTIRDGVGHGKACFLGTVKNSELGRLEIMICFWSMVLDFRNERFAKMDVEGPSQLREGSWQHCPTQCPWMFLSSCQISAPQTSGAPHLRALSVPTPCPQPFQAPPQCQLGSRFVKLQTSKGDTEDNFSHISVWQCQCLSVIMSLAFITTFIFPGTSPLVPPAECQDQLFSLQGLCSDPLAAFHSCGSFLILLPC